VYGAGGYKPTKRVTSARFGSLTEPLPPVASRDPSATVRVSVSRLSWRAYPATASSPLTDFDLACFTVRFRSVLTPAYRALHHDGARSNYGGLLAPGDYTRIAVTGLHRSCAYLAPSRTQPLPVAGPGIGVAGGEAARSP
jgi:hypothetical protein